MLSTLAMTLAASTLAPVLTYTFLWRGFTRQGLLWSVYGAGLLTIALLAVSPLLSGSPSAAFPDMDFQCIALVNPGLVTVPAGFALGWLGSTLDRRSDATAQYENLATAIVRDDPAR
ncbi:hypothetical protein [Streptomyces sp. RTGN2]|uniref:hypothetical protein n=1 Tax=Streptomyces sp. RTGN2 TaxID=3016525 RepID=UPI0025557701|nr:hypothetical protein [Streptomyces sp. RTGN2]